MMTMPLDRIQQIQVDIFGPCNLRCPTCLIGCGGADARNKFKGVMSTETLAAILDKAKAELPALEVIAMHNWTEPLLNPQAAEMVAVAKERGLFVYISSNLNLLRREDDLLRSGLDKLAISVSGYSQERYEIYHRNGNIEDVKTNMRRLAEAKARTGSDTQIVCIFHRYRDNRMDEEMMEEFAHDLGFHFFTTWAFFTPVEKILASQAKDRRFQDTVFTADDEAIARRLAIPIEKRLELSREKGERSMHSAHPPVAS